MILPGRSGASLASFCAALILLGLFPPLAQSEWYAGGYGGVSLTSKLQSVTLPTYGQELAFQRYPAARPQINQASLNQTFKTSDLDLATSYVFGGKVGYFFTDEKMPWLGVEVEAFTSKPNIRTQTLITRHDVNYNPNVVTIPCAVGTCPETTSTAGTLNITESSLRVVTVAFNVIARYPGKVFQPYVGVGGGGFYFQASNGTFQGRQWSPGLNALAGLKFRIFDEWGLFLEGKYNLSHINNLDPIYGLNAQYSILHLVGGATYHF